MCIDRTLGKTGMTSAFNAKGLIKLIAVNPLQKSLTFKDLPLILLIQGEQLFRSVSDRLRAR